MLRGSSVFLVALLAVLTAVPLAVAVEPDLPERHLRQLERELDRVTALAERAASDATLEPLVEEESRRLLRQLHHFRGRLATRGDVERLGDDLRVLEGRVALLGSGSGSAVERGQDEGFGTLTGMVTEASTGAPLADVAVMILTVEPFSVTSPVTGADGSYTAELPAGTYYAVTRSLFGHLDEIWDDVPCPGGLFSGCVPSDGTPIELRANETTSGIDFALERLGAVSGEVTRAADGGPVPFAFVEIWKDDGRFFSSVATDENGVYLAGGLPAGTYYVAVNAFGYLGEVFDDLPCPESRFGDCRVTDGEPIPVEHEVVVSGIDFALEELGTISGTVTDEATGAPLPFAAIEVSNATGRPVDRAEADAEGRYRTSGLPGGTYFVSTQALDGVHVDELYDDRPCPRLDFSRDCDPTTGDPVEVELATPTAGIDFALARGGTVTGTVTVAPTGVVFPAVDVEVWTEDGRLAGSRLTDADGAYAVGGLPTGRYFARTNARIGVVNEVYDGIACLLGDCPATLGKPIAVTLGATTAGIDFALDLKGSVVGRVTNAGTGLPISGMEVLVLDRDFVFVSSAVTSFTGRYVVGDLLPGTYFVRTRSFRGYVDEIHPGVPCASETNICAGGTALTLEVNSDLLNVDFALALASGIQGTVTDALTGEPLAGVDVDVWEDDGLTFTRTSTNAEGRYSVAVPRGVYFVSTAHRGALDEVWDDVACPGGPARDGLCDPLAGTPIVLGSSTIRDGVDFALSDVPCADDELCLNRDRFRVGVVWRSADGSTGPGRPGRLTGDAGYFWFFDPDNVELVVKLLDGCFEPFDSFWFFAAGLTDVGVEITVTDRVTGAAKIYRNPLGTAFRPVLDTGAFATCSSRPVAAAAHELAPHLLPLEEHDAKGVSCAPGPNHLCLNQDRFRVEAFWRTPNGSTGQGRPVRLTRDTGYFWFFSAANVEVVVKVLDACRLQPFHNYWVFAAGLTDVEVTLRVTDVASGEAREYTSPLGRGFQPILDTNAFATCPEL